MSELREERAGAAAPVSLDFALPPEMAARIEGEVAAAMQAMTARSDSPAALHDGPRELVLRLLRERGELTAGDMVTMSGGRYSLAYFRAALKELHRRGVVEIIVIDQVHIYRLRRQA